jgi:hypothetical protein
MTNIQQLRAIMALHNLTRRQVAEISGYSLSTINAYMLPAETSKAHRRLPDRAFETISGKIWAWARVQQ